MGDDWDVLPCVSMKGSLRTAVFPHMHMTLPTIAFLVIHIPIKEQEKQHPNARL